ncbi:hypothetical protein SK128_018523 [Halocaridina rubra]|uniref:Uncharacterized protein n=1 Tax=Halocaridina rubra TaxID=373956 RepID=A0AAN9A1B9_HALRR
MWCTSFKSVCMAASAIHASPSQLRAVSAYKKKQQRQKTASSQQTLPTQSSSSSSCQSCNSRHARECALLLTAPVPTVAVRVTGPGPLDAQPRMRNVAIAIRLSTTTDVARKRTRFRTALQTLVEPFSPTDFRNCMEHWGVHHVRSSPHYLLSNGHTKATVKSVNHLILKTAPNGNIDCGDSDRVLLKLRNSPTSAGRSPTQVL